ncbi:MAG: hypothetical protein ACT4ON_07150 [Bacteroidota bacterium]
MKKLFLLLAFTGIVGAASATSVVALTKGTVITLSGDDKKQDDKKKCAKGKSCCKSKQTAQAESGCAGQKTAEAKACSHGDKIAAKNCAKSAEVTKEAKAEAVIEPTATTPVAEK